MIVIEVDRYKGLIETKGFIKVIINEIKPNINISEMNMFILAN